MVQKHSSHKRETAPIMSDLLLVSVFHQLQSSSFRETATGEIYSHTQISNPDFCRCGSAPHLTPSVPPALFLGGFYRNSANHGLLPRHARFRAGCEAALAGIAARSRTAFPTAGFLRLPLCRARPSAAPALPSGGRRGTCSARLRCAFTAAPLPGARTGQTSDRRVNE